MSQQLISRNSDLKKLRDEGYELQINGGYICIHHVPYVNHTREILSGTLVCALNLASPTTIKEPKDHTIFFMGEIPCHKDGSYMNEILNNSPNKPLFEGIVGNHYFSSKPPSGKYSNFYEKFTTYISIISAPAKSLNPLVTAQTFKPFKDSDEDSPFVYFDTNSSRADIVNLNSKLEGQKIAIIGLGGTGSYILDQIAKTPVSEIHLFDGDIFSQHNAFRSPGAPSIEELDRQMMKVDYFHSIYSKMHKGISAHSVYVTEDNINLLESMSYVFVCIDKNMVRGFLIKSFLNMNISFIDVGLGVEAVDNKLIGIVRVTAGTPEKYDHLEKRIPTAEVEDNDYSTNIQIADLNALNAMIAVIKWKKMSNYYDDQIGEFHTSYSINVAQLINGDTTV